MRTENAITGSSFENNTYSEDIQKRQTFNDTKLTEYIVLEEVKSTKLKVSIYNRRI